MSDAYSSQDGFRDRVLERLCLQFLYAGDWKAVLEKSDLPDDVTALIREVVTQTGLLRFEKSEITTELIHHFQDGHDRGHSFDELVRDFGTTDVAVSLFRSSKLRSRPVSVKAFRGSMMAFGGGLISYLLLQLFFHSATPNPSVDYAAKLNEAVTSMPAEEQAWPLYRDVWVKHGLVESAGSYEEIWFEEPHRDAPEVEWSNGTKSLRLIRPSDEGWDQAVGKLKSLKELLNVLRKGSKLPYVGVPLFTDISRHSDEDLAALFYGQTREMIEDRKNNAEALGLRIDSISKNANEMLDGSPVFILLPHIQQFRRAARLLRVDTRYAMQQGDHNRAIENIKTIFQLGRQAGNNPISICSLVGIAVQGIGFDVIEELTDEHLDDLSNEELKSLQELAASVDLSSVFKNPSFEKEFVLDMIQRIYSDDGNGDGRMTAVGMEVQYVCSKMVWTLGSDDDGDWFGKPMMRLVAGPVSLFTAPSRKEMELLVDDLFEKQGEFSQLTMWQALESSFDLEEYVKEKDESGFLYGMVAGQGGMSQSRETKIARQDAVLLSLAMHRYKRSNGQWPTKLEQLTGNWIDRTPIDRLSGKALQFAIKKDAPIVYSLGHDGDDDGGVNTNSNAPWLDRESDGDWVLWPTNPLE